MRDIMYLMLDNINKENESKVRKLLNDNDIKYHEFETPLQMFCWEEAYYRLNKMCNNSMSLESKQEFINDNQEGLMDKLYEDDYVVDGEYVEDLTFEFIDTIKDKIKSDYDILLGFCQGCGNEIYSSNIVNKDYTCPICDYHGNYDNLF